jgi:hypothetical protein
VKGKQGDRWETVEFRNPMVSKVIKELAPNNALSQKWKVTWMRLSIIDSDRDNSLLILGRFYLDA